MTINTLHEFKLFRDKYDPWGSAMSLFFDVSAELWWRGDTIPWDYSPGAVNDPRETDSHYADMVISESSDDLLDLGKLLERYTSMLDKKGESY